VRILLVHNAYRSGSPGGEDRVFETEHAALAAAGHEVATYRRSNDEVFEGPWQHRLSALRMLFDPSVVHRQLSSLIRDFRPDVAHFHNVFPLIGVAGYRAAAAQGVPVVQTVHNYRWSCTAGFHFTRGAVCTRCTPRSYSSAVRLACYRDSRLASWSAGRANARMWRAWTRERLVDRFITLTPFMADRLVNAGVPRARVVIKPNAVDQPAISATISKGTFSKGRYVVFSGRLSVEKGLLTLLEAWRQLPDIPLKVIGDGPLSTTVAATLRRERLPVEMMGYLAPKAAQELVAGAALQVIPSQWFEGMPLVLLEAWALGTPVVASRIGGLSQMITPGVDGEYVEPGDAVGLAAVVRALMSDDSRRASLALAGRRSVERRYGMQQNIQALQTIYATARQVE
jgi:glycosyltransferase involved in cell wall biosynthesis